MAKKKTRRRHTDVSTRAHTHKYQVTVILRLFINAAAATVVL